VALRGLVSASQICVEHLGVLGTSTRTAGLELFVRALHAVQFIVTGESAGDTRHCCLLAQLCTTRYAARASTLLQTNVAVLGHQMVVQCMFGWLACQDVAVDGERLPYMDHDRQLLGNSALFRMCMNK
jgi:hypothetical protein